MGRIEHEPLEPTPQPNNTSQRRIWRTLLSTLVSGLMLTALGAYFGLPIEMTPWKPPYKDTPSSGGDNHTPILQLREVFIQSTPQPPSQLQALGAFGGRAGKQMLKNWYEDQAEQARTRGYTFPFRLERWRNPHSSEKSADGVLSRLWTMARSYTSQSEGFDMHEVELNYRKHAAPIRIDSKYTALGSSDPGRVRASGTSRFLLDMREKYLKSQHGLRHSYWSATPERMANPGKKQYGERRADAGGGVTEDRGQWNGDDDSDDDPLPQEPTHWEYYIDDGLLVPNVSHKKTLVNIARMAANAYQPTDSETWESLGDSWDTHDSFGWTNDGIRGHVFADSDNTTVVVTFKGTSSTFFLGGGSETSVKDKFNDNRLFSCCCAYVDFTWSTVCDCHMSGSKCNATCLQDVLAEEVADNYFHAAARIFMDVAERYHNASIVLTGHSLGGSIATLLGLTFGVPSVGFEAPGDKMAAMRLHLPMPPAVAMERLPLFHVGNTADPVFMGVCSGRTSSCYYAGYALESRCHLGRQMVFDTVGSRGWRMDIRHHRINEVIYLVFEPWGQLDPEETMPAIEHEDPNCVDCGLWKFIDEESPR